jgi:hypothetical protein
MGHPQIRPSFFKSKSIPSSAYADASIPATALAAGIPTSNDFGAAGIKTDLIVQSTAGSANLVVSMSDNVADGLNIKQAGNSYLLFDTTNGGEQIVAAKVIVANGGVTGNVTGNCTGDAAATVGNITAMTRLSYMEAFGAEAANAIDGSVIVGGIYVNYNEVRRFRLRVWDDAVCTVPAVNATLSLTPAGDGTVVSGSGTVDMVVTTAGGSGRFSLRVSDAAAETVYVSCEPVIPCAENSTGVIWGNSFVSTLVFA